MIKQLRKIIDIKADHCNKELEIIKRSQSKLDSSTAKIKTSLKAVNNRLNDAEKWISDLEDRVMEITQSEQQTDKWEKKWKQHAISMG